MDADEPVIDVTATATTVAAEDPRVRRVELLISRLLRAGVVVSVVVVLLGIGLTFVNHPSYRSSPEELVRLTRPGATAEFPTSAAEVGRGLVQLQGRAVVVLGLLLLVATPIVRVGAAMAAFVYEKDRRFVWITGVVLGLLVVSFLAGIAH